MSAVNFFVDLLAKFFVSSDPDVIKKRKLKEIAKRLSKGRYKFYKAGSREVLPAFAKFFYDIYKSVYPVQALIRSMPNEMQVKHMIIGFFMTDRQKKLEELLSAESINEKAKTIPVSKLIPQAKEALKQFSNDFNPERTGAIEAMYKQFLLFRDFCMFDYFMLLRKFSPSLHEGDFNAVPKFEKIKGEYIRDDLKDFISVAWTFPLDADWTLLLRMFKEARDKEPIAASVLKKISARISSIRAEQTFEIMIQLITEDPLYEPKESAPKGAILEQYIDKFRTETLGALHSLESAEKDVKVNGLLQQVFGNGSIAYLKNYTADMATVMESRNLNSYTYHGPLNYLKGFLLEFVKKDIRTYCDLVLVRGKWATPTLSASMSDAYNDLLSMSEVITKFDGDLAEDGPIGIKIKTMLPRTGKENDSRNIINRLVADANEQAKEFVMVGIRNVLTIGKTIKALLEDEEKKSPDLLTNWQELERFADTPMKELGTDIYKKIYLFATLIQTCMSGSGGE